MKHYRKYFIRITKFLYYKFYKENFLQKKLKLL